MTIEYRTQNSDLEVRRNNVEESRILSVINRFPYQNRTQGYNRRFPNAKGDTQYKTIGDSP